MKLGIVVNVMGGGDSGQTTYRLAAEAATLGHEVCVISTGNFACDADDAIRAHARIVPPGTYRSHKQLTAALRADDAGMEWISVDTLDVLLLRSNPSVQHGWAQHAGIHFGRLAMRRGVIVLNDPNGLAKAMNKLYLNTFPETVRPRTLITRSQDRIAQFAREEGTLVLKPLQGSGGKNVFLLRPTDVPNLEQIVHAISRDGYVIAQEYLPAAAEGDTRLFLLNGRPLRHKGRYAAFRRIRTGDDVRSNIHAGGRLRRAHVDETMLRVADMVRPRLVEDGMFLVGLDIAGDKLMEVNVFSPGGLGSALLFEKVNFARAVIDALERKVRSMRDYRRNFSNQELATL